MTLHPLVVALAVTLLSLATPTAAFVAERRSRPAARPPAAKLAAWLCMWIGQLAIPATAIAWRCAALAVDWNRPGSRLAAVVYGAAMTMIAGFVAILAVRLFALGPVILAAGTDDAVATRARGLAPRALAMVAVIALYACAVLDAVPMPGHLSQALIYLALVLVPVGLVAALVAIAALALRRPPWRAAP